jgi:hypothetical protein
LREKTFWTSLLDLYNEVDGKQVEGVRLLFGKRHIGKESIAEDKSQLGDDSSTTK